MGDFSGREPCPYRILDDIGGAYAMGCVGGSIWHFVKGWRNAPKGSATSGAFEQVRVRAPVVGGNFAVWGGLFACFDCSLVVVRAPPASVDLGEPGGSSRLGVHVMEPS